MSSSGFFSFGSLGASLSVHAAVAALCLHGLSSATLDQPVQLPPPAPFSVMEIVYHSIESSAGDAAEEVRKARSPSETRVLYKPAESVNAIAPSDKTEAHTVAERPSKPQPRNEQVAFSMRNAPDVAKKVDTPKESQEILPAQPLSPSAPEDSAMLAAARSLTASESGSLRAGLGGSIEAPGYGNYEALIARHLLRVRQYPERARRRGLEGDVVIDLLLDRSGQVSRAEVISSSRFDLLDTEAIRMVERAAPFPPAPGNYKPGSMLSFRIPVRFELH